MASFWDDAEAFVKRNTRSVNQDSWDTLGTLVNPMGVLGQLGSAANLLQRNLIDNPAREANKAAEEQEAQINAIKAERTEQTRKANLDTERDVQRSQARARAAANAINNSTVLTSPLGVTDFANTSGRKTLLGA